MLRLSLGSFAVLCVMVACAPSVSAEERSDEFKVLFNSDGGIMVAKPPISLDTVLRLNDSPLGRDAWKQSGETITCDNPPARQGDNRLSFHVRSGTGAPTSVRIEKIELLVDYK